MKEYYITDKWGKKKIVEEDFEIKVEILEEPSQFYIDTVLKPLQEESEKIRIQQENEKLIQQRIREKVIKELILEGKLPHNYK